MTLFKNEGSKFKGIYKIIIAIIAVFIAWFILDNILFDIRKEYKGDSKYLYVAYLLVDSSTVENDVKFKDLNESGSYTDKMLDFVGTNIPVKKEGNYYVANFKTLNESAYKNITDYFTSLNNVYAEEVSDIKVDLDEYKAYIPKKYYEDEKYVGKKAENINDKNSPVQMEVLSVIDKKDLNNSKINLTISHFFSSKKILEIENGKDYIDVELFNSPKNLKRDDLKIYINDSEYALPKTDYAYSNKTGLLRLYIGRPIEVNNIKIKVRKFYALNFLNIFRIETVEAATAPIAGEYTVSGGSLSVGDEEVVFLPYMYGSPVASQPAPTSGYHVYCGGQISDDFDCSTFQDGHNYVSLSDITTAWNNYRSSSINVGTVPGAAYFAFRRKAFHCNIYEGATCSLVDFNYLNFGTKHLTMNFKPSYDWFRGTCVNHTVAYNNTSKGMALKFWISAIDTEEGSITIDFVSIGTSGGQQTGGHFKLLEKNDTPKGNIKVIKNASDGEGNDGYKYWLYAGSSCTGTAIAGPAYTDERGEVIFSNLDNGTYCVKEEVSGGYAVRKVNGSDTTTNLKPYNNGNQTNTVTAPVAGKTTKVVFDNNTPGNEDYCLNIVKYMENDYGGKEKLAGVPFTLYWYSSIHGQRSLGTSYTNSEGVASWRFNDRDLPCREDGACYIHNFTVHEGANPREAAWDQYVLTTGSTSPYLYAINGIGNSGPTLDEVERNSDVSGPSGYLCPNNFGLPCGGNWYHGDDPTFTGATMPKCSDDIVNDNTGVHYNPAANAMSEFVNTKVYFCLKVKKEDENGGTIDPSAFSDMIFEASHNSKKIRTGVKYNPDLTASNSGKLLSSINTKTGVVSFFIGDTDNTGVSIVDKGFFKDTVLCENGLCNGPDKLIPDIWEVREIAAPTGYTLNDEKIIQVRPTQMTAYTFIEGNSAYERARKDCLNISDSDTGTTFSSTTDDMAQTFSPYYFSNNTARNARSTTSISSITVNSSNESTADKYVIKNKKLLLQWFKKATDDPDTTPNDEKLVNGAKFSAKRHDNNQYAIPKDLDGDGRIGIEDRERTKDSNGVEKLCYVVDGYQDSDPRLYFESGDVSVNKDGSMNGEVCVVNVNTSKTDLNYIITEVDSGLHYTYGSTKTLTIPAQKTFVAMSDLNTFLNYSTEFEFEKKATAYDEFTGEELSKITFSIYRQNSSGNPVGNPLVVKEAGTLADGTIVYDYLQGTNSTNKLHVSPTTYKFVIKHLPKDKYVIKEEVENTCDDVTDPSKCIGYYVPTNNEQRFSLNVCSSDVATACSNHGRVTANIINTPTEIKLTKSDFYHEYDQADVAIEGNNVPSEFANDKERSDFDRIVFTLYDKDGTPLKLQFVANHGDCTTDDSYAEYRYIRGGTVGSTELHTCGGHIRITHLCRGRTYKVKEESVPENSVFVRENTDSTPIEQTYKVGCDEGDSYRPTTETKLIEDKPTRVTFEKRDAKYNYLIPDETTTFEVYRCPKGQTTCHPGDYTTAEAREAAGMELVKFYSRAVIPGDEEDPGIPVYKMMSYSDAQNRAECQGNNTSNCYVTSVHPYVGKLIFRYLASGSTYVLLETAAPKNYLLPEGRRAETEFTVRTDTVSVEEVNVPNQPTGILIRKYDDEGRLLGGAKFRVKLVTNYNPNKKAQDQEAVTLKFKTIKQGVYEYRPVLDSDLVITCEGPNCSDTSSFTLDRYKDIADFDTLFTSSGEMIKDVLKEGTALIQYLEYDHYYVIEEVEAPKGHSLPDNKDDRFTLVHIGKNTTVIEDTQMKFINYPTPFTFYKFDEYNTPLDGGKFKLQKLNDNKSYVTLNVTKVEGEDSLYKVDPNSSNDIIETTGGKATVYYLEEGQYRIVEVEAPPGKELPKKTINVATFFVDKDGNVFGENIITNKPPTEKKYIKPEAKASLLINIQTGQNVVKYGLIIAALVAAITGLMIYMKKRK